MGKKNEQTTPPPENCPECQGRGDMQRVRHRTVSLRQPLCEVRRREHLHQVRGHR